MKKNVGLLFLLFTLLVGCQQQEANVFIDEEESYISISEEVGALTFYVRAVNDSPTDSGQLFIRFEFDDPRLLEQLSDDGQIVLSSGSEPLPFEVKGEGSFFISELFEFEWTDQTEELEGKVKAVIFNGTNETVAEATLDRAIEE